MVTKPNSDALRSMYSKANFRAILRRYNGTGLRALAARDAVKQIVDRSGLTEREILAMLKREAE